MGRGDRRKLSRLRDGFGTCACAGVGLQVKYPEEWDSRDDEDRGAKKISADAGIDDVRARVLPVI